MGEVFSSFVRYFVKDDATQGMKKVQAEAKKTADANDKEQDKANGKLSKLMGVMGTLGAAAAGAAVAVGAAMGAVGKAALDSYADYEQLVGGVETLFGNRGAKSIEEYAKSVGKSVKDVEKEYARNEAAQELMMKNAANAYKTAGMSANEYMETATSSAAAMVSSLGGDTKKAAKLVDMSVTDMSDNANKMGSNIQDIQNAYGGFAKQNFTMLDNLKLGYGGTQEEMKRLLKDAQAISGVKYDISKYSDVVEAIHVVQTEMGITGTTAKEAASTISGSMAMAKSAWSNFLTGIADENADLGQLTDNLVTSIDAVAGNVVPRLVTIVDGISKAIPTLLPKLLQSGMQIATALLNGIVQALPAFLAAIVGMLPQLTTAVMQLLTTLVTMLPQLITQVLPAIVNAVVGITQALVQALPAFITALTSMIVQIVAYIPVFVPQMIDAAVTLFMALVDALPQIVDALVKAVPTVISAVTKMLPTLVPKLLAAGVKLFMALAQAVPKILSTLLSAIGKLIISGIQTVPKFLGQLLAAGVKLFFGIVEAVPKIRKELIGKLKELLASLPERIKGFAGKLKTAAMDMLKGMVNGIRDGGKWVIDKIQSLCSDALGAVKSFFGIGSPSKVFRATFQWLPVGAGLGIEDEQELPVKAMQEMGAKVQAAAANIVPRINLGAVATIGTSSGMVAGGNVGNGGARVYNSNVNVKTGETDPHKLARMIEREQRQATYELGTL